MPKGRSGPGCGAMPDNRLRLYLIVREPGYRYPDRMAVPTFPDRRHPGRLCPRW